MDLTGIIAISGKTGLFKVVVQSKNSVIVESLLDKKRFPAYAKDKISALEDISIYSYSEDKPLKEIFKEIFKKENGGECISHKEKEDILSAYLLEIFPDYDVERVYPSDIKKLFQWYNLLVKSGNLHLEQEEENKPSSELVTETPENEKPVKKATKTTSGTKTKPTTASSAKLPTKISGKTAGVPKVKTTVQRKSGSN